MAQKDEMKVEKERVIDFVENVKARDHIILFYSKLEDKHQVLFTYSKADLDEGQAGAHVVGEKSIEQIRRTMKKFGTNAESEEEYGALKIIDCKDWYLTNGKFDIESTKKDL